MNHIDCVYNCGSTDCCAPERKNTKYSESDLNALLSVAAKKIYLTAFDLIQSDPHQWSNRGCQTCKTITTLIGKRFGCILYQAQNKDA